MLHGKLAKAKDKLRDAKNELGLVSIESQQKILENQIGLIETEMTRVKEALAGSEGKSRRLRTSLMSIMLSSFGFIV